MTPRILVVADDLTGANAAGARFARLGLTAVTLTSPGALGRRLPSCDVVVACTASRHLPATEAAERVRQAIRAAPPVGLVVKRIDTTLRGNLGAEMDAALDAVATTSSRVRAVVVPAHPDAGRVTADGLQLVDGLPLTETAAAEDPRAPVSSSRVSEVLAVQSSRTVAHVGLRQVSAGTWSARSTGPPRRPR